MERRPFAHIAGWTVRDRSCLKSVFELTFDEASNRPGAGRLKMQKVVFIALALSGVPTAGVAGDNGDALVNSLNAGIDRGIASVQAKLPLKFGRDMTVTGIRRESRTIIYTMDFQLPGLALWPAEVVDNLRESLIKRVCADNGKSWFDLGYVTQLSDKPRQQMPPSFATHSGVERTSP
jgi:hypothetical protein